MPIRCCYVKHNNHAYVVCVGGGGVHCLREAPHQRLCLAAFRVHWLRAHFGSVVLSCLFYCYCFSSLFCRGAFGGSAVCPSCVAFNLHVLAIVHNLFALKFVTPVV